jgi:hypothetical protein
MENESDRQVAGIYLHKPEIDKLALISLYPQLLKYLWTGGQVQMISQPVSL